MCLSRGTNYYVSFVSVYAYSLTDNFLSPILASDWLKFCHGSFVASSKKEMKMEKWKQHKFNDNKQK